MAMLEIKDLEVYYGMIQAIKGISFEVNEGEVIALIGANGAGKTTILHTISGLIAPKKGSITFEGQEITKIPAHKIVENGLAQVPEGRRVFPSLSVLQNLKLGAYTRKDKKEIDDTLKMIYERFRVWKNVKTSRQELSPEVSSRCLPWDVPSCPSHGSSLWMSPPWVSPRSS